VSYSEDLFQLLSRVSGGFVVWHDEAEVHAPGFSWQQSDMSVAFQELCTDALHARLVCLGHHEPWGSAVSLSDTGVARLAEWREQRSAGLRGVA
jgi:hypothetical protein